MEYFACKELMRLRKLLLETTKRSHGFALDSPASAEVENALLNIHAEISVHRKTCRRCNPAYIRVPVLPEMSSIDLDSGV
jgi:hypothetical protein